MDMNTTRPLFKTKPNNPCTRECTDRTYSCKYDGTCDKYKAWKTPNEPKKEEYHHEHSDKRNLVKGLSGGRL